MHEIDSASATDDNHFTEGDPTIPVPATVVTADWLNAIQEEIVKVIEDTGITLNKESNTQLKDALEIMLAEWTPASTSTVAGILKLATSALALAGADDSTAMTPALVKAVVDACRASDDDITTGTSTTKFPSVAQLVEALNNIDSADVDLSNVTDEGKATAVGWGMPDYGAGIDLPTTVGTLYTPESNGVFVVGRCSSSNTNNIYIGSNTNGIQVLAVQYHNLAYCPAIKNTQYYLDVDHASLIHKFYPLQGEV